MTTTNSEPEIVAPMQSFLVPPSTISTEAMAIGCILNDSSALDDLGDLGRESFSIDSYGEIYDCARSLADAGELVNLVTVADALVRRGTLEQCGGHAGLTDMMLSVSVSAGSGALGETLRQYEERRRISSHGISAAMIAGDPSSSISEARAALSAVDDGAREAANIVPIGSTIPDILDDMERKRKGEKPAGCIPFGFDQLDRMLKGGALPGKTYVMAARPGVGKSSWMQCAANNIADRGVPCLEFSLEMPVKQVGERALKIKHGISDNEFFRGTLTRAAYEKHEQALDWMQNAPIHIDDTGGLRIEELCRRARQQKRQNGIGIIFIDYLQLITIKLSGNKNRENEVSAISGRLKALAKDLEVPIVILAQLNRLADGMVPKLSHLRESGSIEQDADVVMFLHPPAVPAEPTEMIIEKNRDGQTGRISLKWEPHITTFSEIPRVFPMM